MGNARNVASRAAWLGSAGISSAVDELNFLVGGHDGDECVGVLVGSTGERRRLHRLRNRSRRGRRGTSSTTGCKNDGEYKMANVAQRTSIQRIWFSLAANVPCRAALPKADFSELKLDLSLRMFCGNRREHHSGTG